MNPLRYHNLNGTELSLCINKQDELNTCLEFTVEYKKHNYFSKLKNVIAPSALLLVVYMVNGMNAYSSYFATAIIICFITYQWTNKLEKESLLVVASIGIQITQTYSCGQNESRFIPWYNIKDIFINEVIHLQRILYLLTVLIENTNTKADSKNEIIPLFSNTNPPLACLELMYKYIQNIFSSHGLIS